MKLRFVLALVVVIAPPLAAQEPRPGQEVDLVPFGHAKVWDGNPGVEWDEPRDVRRVELDFADERQIPTQEAIHPVYWVSSWPPRASGGWTATDTTWQGEWRTVTAGREIAGKTLIFRFAPLTESENSNARNLPGYQPSFRRTLKLRLHFTGKPVPYSALRVYGNARWNAREIFVQSGCEGKEGAEIATTLYNGRLLASAPLEANPPGMRLKLLYTEHDPSSNDRTILTLRAGQHAFGVSVDDVIQRKAIYVKPFGIFLGDAAVGEDFAAYKQAGGIRAGEDIMSRTSRHPEQTLAQATAEIPALALAARSGHPYRYIPLGFPSSREKYALDFNGNVFISKHGAKAMKEDLAHMLWEGDEIEFRLGSGAVPDFREREDAARQNLREDYLPLVTTLWQSEGIEYQEQAYATMLEAPLDDLGLRGDEPSLLFLRLSARNNISNPVQARVWFHVNPSEQLELKNGMLFGTGNEHGPYARPRLRAALDAGEGTFEVRDLPPESPYGGPAVLWTVSLPGQGSKVLDVKIPFRTMELVADQERVRRAQFATRLEETLAYWRKATSGGMRVSVPDEEFNRFFRTALQHLLVSVERDVRSGLYMCPCDTYDYNMFANETDMQVRLLDMRGLPDLAWRCLRPLVELQGSKPFPGRFHDTSAIFHGVRVDADHDYTHSGYNLNHGWTLWTLAEHYLFTRDRNWLKSVMPHLLKAANWIIEERKATLQKQPDGIPVPEYGLLPAGQLEDNEEWQYWLAVNAYAYRGLNAAAKAIDPVEGERLKKEAAAYREDIRQAALRAMSIAPVAPLRDGTYVPIIPPRTSYHGRDFGWIRNVLYGAHALVDCGVFSPDEPIATWILEDYEDNLFMAEDSLSVPDRDWFSRGGVALQPNLVNTFVSYLERDEVPQALRAFYNTFAISYYRDVGAFTEWVPTLGIGGGPFFKTSDESAFLTWLRLLLVRDSGGRLFLNSGAPRNWFLPGRTIEVSRAATFFGEVSFRVEAHPERGFTQARVSLPNREHPHEALLRLRHPEGKKMVSVELNGSAWNEFNAERETISLPPNQSSLALRVNYR